MMKTFTKFFALLFAFTIICSINSNAQHFTDPQGDSGEPLLEIWIYGATMPSGTSLVAGDEIAVFSGNTIVGTLTLTVTPSLTTVWDSRLLAYSKNLAGDNLFTPGEPFTLKCYDGTTEYVAYTWGDGNHIDFHNEWYAPTSESSASTTQGAFFPAEGAYSYCYVDATFVAGSLPLEADLAVVVWEADGTTKVTGATVISGGYSGVAQANPNEHIYDMELFAGTSGSTDDYTYTITISKTGFTTETLDVTVNGDNNGGIGYTQTVLLDAKGNLSGIVQGYEDPTGALVVVDSAIVSVTIDTTRYADTTDIYGTFLIEDIPDGDWTFTITYANHNDLDFDATITNGNTTASGTHNLTYLTGTLEGEIFDATTISLISSASTLVEIYEVGTTTNSLGSATALNGDYSISYYGGTYDIKFSSDTYDDVWLYEQTLYPNVTETQNINMLPTGTQRHFAEISGNPNQMWTIQIEMAKFGANYLLPFDELVIFDVDQPGSVGEPGLRVGSLRLPNAAIWQNAGSNALKAFAQFNNGSTGFVEGNELEIWAYDISHSAVYETPLNWWFNTGLGTYSGTTFPNPAENHVSYLNIYWETAPGQLSGTITGGGSGLENVNVEALNVFTQEVVNNDLTDAQGNYSMPLDDGTYKVRVSKQDWKTIIKENVAIVQNGITDFDTTLLAYNLVTAHYELGDVWEPGFYFIGRCLVQNPTQDNMLTLLDNSIGSWTPFSRGFYTSWVENDEGLRLDNTDGTPSNLTWDPMDYTWELNKGYQVFRSAYYHFDMTGYPVEPGVNPISFASAGIYYVPYFPYDFDNPDDAITAFAGIFDDLDWVMDSEGNRLHNDGGIWVDNIGTLSPTEGYKIKINKATTLTYPSAASKSISNRSRMLEPEHFVYSGGNAANWTYTIYIATDEFDIGDEIAAYSNGRMVGSMVIDSDDAWENDLNTFVEAVNEGYAINSPIEFMAWDASENIDYHVGFEMININNACYHGTTFPAGLDQFSYAYLYRGTVRIDENQVENDVKVYPNPVNSTLNIESVSNINNIQVYSIHGVLISNTSVNTKKSQIDVSNLVTGVYMIQLHTNTGVITKRVVVK